MVRTDKGARVAHEIKMTAPGVVIGKQDVVFEVFIDKIKRGELHVSQGNLRWRPRSNKKIKGTATWTEFAEWMES